MAKSKEAFRTISEVADWLETQAHVLRFWESKFTQVRPVKRAGGRRYYRPADMLLLGGIKKLLHDDGMTIKGAQKMMREQGVKEISALSRPIDDDLMDGISPKPAAPDVKETAQIEDAVIVEPEVVDDVADAASELQEATTVAEIVELASVTAPAEPEETIEAPIEHAKSPVPEEVVEEVEETLETSDTAHDLEDEDSRAVPSKPLAEDTEGWKRRKALIERLLETDHIPATKQSEVAAALIKLKALRKQHSEASAS